MIVKNLATVDFDKIIDCFLIAFENYYVPMPTDINYYRQRWKAARVDLSLSYGMFDEERLVGFIINAIDQRNGVLTAFNTGTGVLPEYRGQRIVKSIYAHALPDLQKNGVINCALEVIQKNKIAIKSYQSIGFEICKSYLCFAGTLNLENQKSVDLLEVNLDKIDWDSLPNQASYSWDFQQASLQNGVYKCFQVLNNNVPESFFIINPDNGYLAQCDLLNKNNQGWENLFSGIHQISPTVKIINVDDRLTDKIEHLEKFGLENTVNQFEMEMGIEGNVI